MRRTIRSSINALLVAAAVAVAVACTPGGYGSTAAPAGSVVPGGPSTAPASVAPDPSGKGGYGY